MKPFNKPALAGGQHEAQGGAQRNPGLRDSEKPAREGGRQSIRLVLSPVSRAQRFCLAQPRGYAALHPGLYAARLLAQAC